MKNKHYLYDAENILSIYEWLNKDEISIDVGAHIGTQSIPFSLIQNMSYHLNHNMIFTIYYYKILNKTKQIM
jgi:penicillin-binding protein-related factor A (putative recombinase)